MKTAFTSRHEYRGIEIKRIDGAEPFEVTIPESGLSYTFRTVEEARGFIDACHAMSGTLLGALA